jgi:hypothetical protein
VRGFFVRVEKLSEELTTTFSLEGLGLTGC